MSSMNVLDCGTLIDGVSEEPIADARIVIEDGVISRVGTQEGVSIPDDASVRNHPDETVIPGMIDAHVHLAGWRSMDPNDWLVEDRALGAARATTDLRRLLAAGFTAVRDVGSKTGLSLRAAVEEGEIPGPRIYSSDLGLSQTAGHEDVHYMPYEWVADDGTHLATLADGADECRKETRKRIRKGVDLIKIQTTGGVLSEKDEPDQAQYTPPEIAAVTEEAHRVGIPVAAHAQHSVGIKLALENGVDTIEHGFMIDEESIELMLDTDAVFVPTLWAGKQIADHGEEYGVPEYGIRKAENVGEKHRESIKRAYDAGVPIALGTDNLGTEPLGPHGRNAEEAILYVDEVGMAEMDVIKAATSVAARAVADDTIGAIAEGRKADLVALDSNPLDDIGALEAVNRVYKDGEPVEL